MTDSTAQEPTMEEILASIRRIISEDDAPAAETAPVAAAEPEPAAEPEVEPEPAPVAAEEDAEEVFDLTDRYEAPAAESIGDLDVTASDPEPFPSAYVEPEPEPVPAPAPAPTPAAPAVDFETLVGERAASSAASAFAGLAASVRQNEPISANGVGPTIDDLARALLRPMLKEWLDANLPGIVEEAVRKEVQRIARNAG